MRHNVLKNRFGRTTTHRLAMMRNMVTNLLKHERMETTIPKAKEVKRHAEKIITLSKRVTLERLAKATGKEKTDLNAKRIHAMRLARETVQDAEVLKKLFDELGSRYATRPGGYTRIMRIGNRLGDGAETGYFELVDRPEKSDKDEKKAKGDKKDKKPRSENRPKKEAAPKKGGRGPGGSKPLPSGPKGGGFDPTRGRGGSRGS